MTASPSNAEGDAAAAALAAAFEAASISATGHASAPSGASSKQIRTSETNTDSAQSGVAASSPSLLPIDCSSTSSSASAHQQSQEQLKFAEHGKQQVRTSSMAASHLQTAQVHSFYAPVCARPSGAAAWALQGHRCEERQHCGERRL